jgi:hypothetical protein
MRHQAKQLLVGIFPVLWLVSNLRTFGRYRIKVLFPGHISPILRSLSILHNFTIESQVQFHAPLAFKPQLVGDDAYGLSPEDLTVFVNSAEWTLC